MRYLTIIAICLIITCGCASAQIQEPRVDVLLTVVPADSIVPDMFAHIVHRWRPYETIDSPDAQRDTLYWPNLDFIADNLKEGKEYRFAALAADTIWNKSAWCPTLSLIPYADSVIIAQPDTLPPFMPGFIDVLYIKRNE